MKGRLFTEKERQILADIIIHRRTEFGGNFISQEIPDSKIEPLLCAALNAPSVGFSQPWEFVIIRDPLIKAKIKTSFEKENEKAKEIFKNKPFYNQRLLSQAIRVLWFTQISNSVNVNFFLNKLTYI
ncbi:MAG: nitroreductase family protein [Trichodesmium sp.]